MNTDIDFGTSTKQRIRKALGSLVNHRERQLDLGYGTKRMEMMEAVGIIRTYLDYYKPANDQAHINLVIILMREIRLVMYRTRTYEQKRQELERLVDWCRQNHTIACTA